MVMKQVERQTEVKEAYYMLSSTSGGSYNYSGFGSNQIQVVSPYNSRLSIAQGTGQGDRIGNSIRVKSGHIKLYFSTQPYDATFNPIPQPNQILWFLFRINNSYVEGSALTNFFQQGDAAATPNGSGSDLVYDVNKNLYTVVKSGVLKLGNSAYPGTGTNAGYQTFANNDYQLSHVLDIDYTPFIRKKLEFNDTTNTCTNECLQFAFWTVAETGAIQGTGISPTVFWLQNHMYYTDA